MRAHGQTPETTEMAEVPVNGKVLIWARTIRGLSIEGAADLLGVTVDDLRAYESGAQKPLVGFLRQIASKYRVNFTSLLMPEPLPLLKPPTDHRTRPAAKPLSIDTLVAIEEVSEALDAFEDIAEEDARLVPKLRIGSATLQEDPEEVAARERRKFDVSFDTQRSWSGSKARNQWRYRVEAKGVFTYMIPMPFNELSGFSLLRENVAAICINDNEFSEGARIFTLFHEYCHLLLRQAGISDESDTNRVERFCNEFAACFLIPKTALSEAISVAAPYEFSDNDIHKLARRFRVSNRAIALRLEKTGLAPHGFYARRTAPWDVPGEPKPIAEGSQPSPVRIRLKRVGRLHAETVLQAVEHRAINSLDAAELIGLRSAIFPKLRTMLG
jgi:Zn-dependent peptidase ImmA (M78 family)